MNPPSTLTQNRSGCLKPDEFLPLRRPGSEAPVSPRRKNRDSNWWNNPNPTQESLEDDVKAKKEGNDLKANTTNMAPASFVEEEGDAPNPAEETLSIDTYSSITKCEQAPKKLTNVPAEIQIASVTITNVDESDEQKETTAAREYAPSSPMRSNWKPDDFLPLARPASPVRQSRQAMKDCLPMSSPTRKSRLAAKETAAVNTDEKHTVSRSIATDIDDSLTISSHSSWKLDDFRSLRRPSEAPSSASPSIDSKPHVEKSPREHTSLPVEVQIDCFDTEAINFIGLVDATFGVDEEVEHTIRNKAVCAEELVEKPAVKLRSSMYSLGNSSVEWEKPEWAGQRLKETGKAHFLKSEGNFAKPVTFPVGKGDGVNKEAQPGAVLKNKGVTTTEKNIEWEKPDWTKCRELKATGKADVLNSEGNLARPISLPVGSNSDAGTETETNIACEIRSRITLPFASRRKFF